VEVRVLSWAPYTTSRQDSNDKPVADRLFSFCWQFTRALSQRQTSLDVEACGDGCQLAQTS
jgi:hypothetical protein